MPHPLAAASEYKKFRQRARTDLIWLAWFMLGYKDVRDEVHGKMADTLQKFQGGDEEVEGRPDQRFHLRLGSYHPKIDKWELEGKRKTLILMPRGHLKTTVATIAYGIQWLINYPDVRILLSSATGDQVAGFLREMKSHFQVNERFRYYFPDFCPHKNVKEFGNQDSFSLPNRQVLLSTGVQKEFSVKTVSVGAVVASAHYDVILNDDPVDKENVRTPEQIANVKSHLGYLWPLLETAPGADKRADGYRRGWWHYTGTPYDFSDASSSILDSEAALPEDKKTYFIYKQSALISGELSEEPCMKAACGLFGLHQLIDHAKTLWPSRMPARALLDIAKDPLQGYSLLSSQYLMNPIPEKSGLIESPDQIVWVPMDAVKKIYAYLSLHVTIDLAGMEPSTNKLADNDFTVINLHGFGHDGTLFILNVLRGRYTPMEVIDLLFNLAKLHPRIMDFKVEKEAHARVLLPFLKREMVKRQTWLPMVEIRRDNRTSKQQRIKGLQPWFRNGSIKFADNQPHKLAIINEIMRFPKFAHDDILDTIADAMQGRDGSVQMDVVPMKNEQVPSGMLDGKKDGDILYWKAARFEIPNLFEPKKDGGETEYVGTLDPLTGF